jgi:hypothetical protein
MGIVNSADLVFKGGPGRPGLFAQYVADAPKLMENQALVIDIPEEFSANPPLFLKKITASLRHSTLKQNIPANSYRSRLTADGQVAIMRRPGVTPAPAPVPAPKPAPKAAKK